MFYLAVKTHSASHEHVKMGAVLTTATGISFLGFDTKEQADVAAGKLSKLEWLAFQLPGNPNPGKLVDGVHKLYE